MSQVSIVDYLGLVGDTADGFPGLLGLGALSTSTVLAAYGFIDIFLVNPEGWISDGVSVRGTEDPRHPRLLECASIFIKNKQLQLDH